MQIKRKMETTASFMMMDPTMKRKYMILTCEMADWLAINIHISFSNMLRHL